MELLASFSLYQIITIIVGAAFAVKGAVSFQDWAIEKIEKCLNKKTRVEKEELKIDELNNKISELTDSINQLNSKVNDLVDSDRDNHKFDITVSHHNYMQKGYIDDYCLDCLEKKYKHYVKEGGNSFIESLMKEIRNLPRTPQNK